MATASSSKPHEFVAAFAKLFISPDNNIKADTAEVRLRRYLCVGTTGFIHHGKNGKEIIVDKPMYIDGVFYITVTSNDIKMLREVAQSDANDWYTQLARFIIKDALMLFPTCGADTLVFSSTIGDDITFTYQEPKQRARSENTETFGNAVKYVLVGALVVFGSAIVWRNPSILTDAAKAV